MVSKFSSLDGKFADRFSRRKKKILHFVQDDNKFVQDDNHFVYSAVLLALSWYSASMLMSHSE